MAREVFISHSAHDKAIANAICAALEGTGLRCWLAPRDVRPGRPFPGEITRAVRQSKVLVLVFSGHSNRSEQVLREIQLAVDCHLPILRFRIEDVALTDDLQYFLSTPHWLDALTPPLSEHITRLEIAVRELLGQPAEEAGGSMVGNASPPPKAAGREPESAAPESSTRWKLPTLAAGVIIAVLAAVAWLRQPAAPDSPQHEFTPAAASPAARTPDPTPVVAEQTPTPTVATQTPTPAAATGTPPSSPVALEPNKAGPSLRNGRPWQTWIDDFVRRYVRSSESNDVDLAGSFFAAKVDLFEEGLKSTDAIRRDIETYNARWPTRRATIRGDVQLSEKTPDRGYTASFQPDYYVENPTRGEWINLAVSVDLQISITDGVPKITSMKQKTLRKEKGTMQPRSAAKTDDLSGSVSASATPSPALTGIADADPGLVRVTNTRYDFSALIPQSIFQNSPTTFAGDRQLFSSADGRTTLELFVRKSNSPRALRENFERWAAEHTRSEPAKTVDYKVLRDDWFVVSGEIGERGFYLKAVAKRDVLVFLHLEYDKDNYPFTKETLTAMSRAFDGK